MPDGALGPADQEWLAAVRRACRRIGEAIAPLGPDERREPQGRGAGGDMTARVDRVAEDIVLEEMRGLGRPLRVVGEEAGEVALGGAREDDPFVVVDPIDGSVNAMRGLPFIATSIALLPIVMLEGAAPARVARAAAVLEGRTERLRALGSLALSLCHTAGGRADAMADMGPGRSVDVAAAQLVARETGLLVGMPGTEDVDVTPLDLDARFRVTAAHDAATIDLLRGLAG